METAPLGRTSLNVSRIGLGCWQAHGWANSDDRTFKRIVHTALECGITLFDVAEGYGNGHAELLLGQALKGKRDEVCIATKFNHNRSLEEPLRKSLERSLKRLGTDYVDIYQQHWPPKTPALEETLCVLEALKSEGKIRAVGVSNWMDAEWGEIAQPSRVDSVQNCYSLAWPLVEQSVLPLCKQHGIGFLAYAPLCQGLLTGRFRTLSDIPNDVRSKNVLLQPDRFEKLTTALQVLDRVALALGRSQAAVALRWLLDNSEVTSVLVGATKEEQVHQNLSALGWSLEPTQADALRSAFSELCKDLAPNQSLWNWHPRW